MGLEAKIKIIININVKFSLLINSLINKISCTFTFIFILIITYFFFFFLKIKIITFQLSVLLYQK